MFKNFIITLSGSIGQLLIAILGSILAARLLGAEARGELAAIQLLPTLLITIAALGTPSALTYYTARSPKDAGTLLGSSLAIANVGILIALIAGWIATPYILKSQPPEIIDAGLVYLLLVPLAIYYGTPWSIFLGLQDYISFNILKLLPNIAYLIAIFSALFYLNPIKIIEINLILISIFVLPSVWITYKLRIDSLIRVNFQTMRKIGGYSFSSFLTSLLPIINQRIEYFFILGQLNTIAMGVYAVAAVAGQAQLTIISSIGAILLPNVASSEVKNKNIIFSRLLRLTIIVSTLSTFFLISILPELLSLLYGKEFLDALTPALILVAASGLMGINQIIAAGFRGVGRPSLVLWSEAISLITKVIILLLTSQVNLTIISFTILMGAFAGLIFNIFLFHRNIEKLNTQWLGSFLNDYLLMLNILRAHIPFFKKSPSQKQQ